MVKLHLRSFQKKAYIDATDAVVFPDAIKMLDAVIPDGGTLSYETPGTDLQQQISANTTSITALQSGGHSHVVSYVYVDVARGGESYTEDGSEEKPYRSLSGALNSGKLADAQTETVIFKLAPGDYIGTISIDKTTANQKFEIRGSGENNCRIMGSASWDPTIGTVLYFRDFLGFVLSDVTVQFGGYGLYTRSIDRVVCERVTFQFLGSSGVNHSMDRTQAQMAADWSTRGVAGSDRSDGGAMRIRGAANVILSQCTAYHTLRGFRLQNCAAGQVINCQADRCLESGIYGASGSYDGQTGSSNLFISGCNVTECWNNGILIIGGSHNTVTGCRVYGCANSAIMGWHTQDLTLMGNTLDYNVRKTYNGIGNDGDSWGCVTLSGDSNLIDSEGYMLVAVGNTMSRVGQGRHTEAVGFWMDELDDTLTSYRCIIDNNNIDCEPVYRPLPNPIVTTTTHYQSQEQLNIVGNAIAGLDVLTATQGSYISTAQTNIATNAASITTNATAITGKQATLSFSTVDADHATNPVTSANIKSYVDSAGGGGGDVYLANVNTFTANQEIKKNGNVKLSIEHTGYGTPLEIGNNYGDAGITYVGKSAIKFNGKRIGFEGGCVLLKLPTVSTKDTSNAAHGCLVVDDSGGASNLKLYFNTGGAWVQIS